MNIDCQDRRDELRAAAKTLAREVGTTTMRALHREDRRLDAIVFVGVWSVIGALFYLLGTIPLGAAWLALFLLQGFALQTLGFCAHDLFLHRRVGGARWARILGELCMMPLLVSETEYETSHLVHHWYLGTRRDGEGYKVDMDRRWVKLLCLVAPGAMTVMARAFRRPDTAPQVPPERTAEEEAHIRQEQRALLVFLLVVAGTAWLWPRMVILGYVLPALLSLQWASTLRVILEHGETDPRNPFHAATCYVAGPVTGTLFLYSAGDAHLIHHLFPNIPLYRMGQARAALLPLLERRGVTMRRSLPWLTYEWFVHNRQHATRWS